MLRRLPGSGGCEPGTCSCPGVARTCSGWTTRSSGGHDPPHCRDCTWMGILLTALVLSTWLPTASLQLTLVSIPPQPTEDQVVTLSVRGVPRTARKFCWYRGRVLPDTQILIYDIATQSNLPGPAHTGREVGLADGSLQIQEVREDDAGQYTLQVISLLAGSPPLTGTVNLKLSGFPTGTDRSPQSSAVSGLRIVPVPQHPRVGEDITLSIWGLPGLPKTYTWYRGAAGKPHLILRYNTGVGVSNWLLGPAHSGREAGTKNGSLLLRDVSPQDSGRYIVHVVTLQGKEEASITIDVSLGPTTPPAEKVPGFPTGTDRSPQSSALSGLQIVPVPQHPRVGGNITLSIWGLLELPKTYTWYRGAAGGPHRILRCNTGGSAPNCLPGPAHSGRETCTKNGSLLLRDVSPQDSGRYIVHVVTLWGKEEASITIDVSPEPTTPPAEKAPVPVPSLAASGGIIAALVVGILVGTSLLGALGYWLFHFRRRSRGSPRLTETVDSGEKKLSVLRNRDQGNAYEDLNFSWKKAKDPSGTTVPSFPEKPMWPLPIYEDLQVGNADIYSELQLPA
uniref:Immunoglobulin domain-containing protein n=1 Tax=Ornithorhynchus anatinus TaxID=9258 RepID=A0A6I8N4E9_ORNAN